jgi:hypothetical protein
MTTVTRLTRLIDVGSGTYPLFLTDMPLYAPNTLFGATVDSELLVSFGIEVVQPTSKPAGDVVLEGRPELIDGVWHQTWTVRSFDPGEASSKLAEKKALLTAQAATLQLNAFTKGFPYQFDENTIYHVQVRTTDRGNISDLRTIAKELVAAGQDMAFEFRVWENVSVDLNAAQMVALADKTFVQVLVGYKTAWKYKDDIAKATTMEELPAPPAEFFTL